MPFGIDDILFAALLGGGLGAVTNPKKPLQGALMGAVGGGLGGALMPALGIGSTAATGATTGAEAAANTALAGSTAAGLEQSGNLGSLLTNAPQLTAAGTPLSQLGYGAQSVAPTIPGPALEGVRGLTANPANFPGGALPTGINPQAAGMSFADKLRLGMKGMEMLQPKQPQQQEIQQSPPPQIQPLPMMGGMNAYGMFPQYNRRPQYGLGSSLLGRY